MQIKFKLRIAPSILSTSRNTACHPTCSASYPVVEYSIWSSPIYLLKTQTNGPLGATAVELERARELLNDMGVRIDDVESDRDKDLAIIDGQANKLPKLRDKHERLPI